MANPSRRAVWPPEWPAPKIVARQMRKAAGERERMICADPGCEVRTVSGMPGCIQVYSPLAKATCVWHVERREFVL